MLIDLLNHRRAVRHYSEQPIDADTVRACLEQARLAPSSSNMQLYQFIHVTDPATLQALAAACLGQQSATTAQQMVVFVTRQIAAHIRLHSPNLGTRDDLPVLRLHTP